MKPILYYLPHVWFGSETVKRAFLTKSNVEIGSLKTKLLR